MYEDKIRWKICLMFWPSKIDSEIRYSHIVLIEPLVD